MPQVHRRSKTNGQVGYERPATQRDADTTSTLSGGKLRFASLLASKKNERCLDPMSERSGLQSVCVAGCNNVTDKGVQVSLLPILLCAATSTFPMFVCVRH